MSILVGDLTDYLINSL